jgi:hypothetical protein
MRSAAVSKPARPYSTYRRTQIIPAKAWPSDAIDRWWLRDDDFRGSSATPVLSALSTQTAAGISYTQSVIKEADSTLCGGAASNSARIEFCKYRGVDYVRAKKYIRIVSNLDRVFVKSLVVWNDEKHHLQQRVPEMLAPPVWRRSTCGGPDVRVRITKSALHEMTSLDRCPLCGICGDDHAFWMCPHLPSELPPL